MVRILTVILHLVSSSMRAHGMVQSTAWEEGEECIWEWMSLRYCLDNVVANSAAKPNAF
jgi:hypothetical protein